MLPHLVNQLVESEILLQSPVGIGDFDAEVLAHVRDEPRFSLAESATGSEIGDSEQGVIVGGHDDV